MNHLERLRKIVLEAFSEHKVGDSYVDKLLDDAEGIADSVIEEFQGLYDREGILEDACATERHFHITNDVLVVLTLARLFVVYKSTERMQYCDNPDSTCENKKMQQTQSRAAVQREFLSAVIEQDKDFGRPTASEFIINYMKDLADKAASAQAKSEGPVVIRRKPAPQPEAEVPRSEEKPAEHPVLVAVETPRGPMFLRYNAETPEEKLLLQYSMKSTRRGVS